MSKGLVTPTVPTDDEIVYGEFLVYANKDLPTELFIGASRGGCKINIERAINEMPFDGAYGAIMGLRRYEKFMIEATINLLYLKYFNVDIISDCESDGYWESQDWGQNGGTYAAETSIIAEGNQSSKMTANTSGYGIHEVFAASKDLTVFANGEVSNTADFIGFSIYITTQDKTDLGSSNLRIAFHMDAEGTETNQYFYDVVASALTANKYNKFKIAKSAFTEQGSGDWSAVLGVSMKLSAAPDAEVVCYLDHITLIQNQSKSTIVPVNGGGMSYTDEGNYRKFLPDLTLNDSEYYENIVICGQKHSGKAFEFWLYNVLNDGKITLGLEEKDEVINDTKFTAHFKSTTPTTIPLKIRDYDV